MRPMFSVGTGNRTQAAQREDGQWFIRCRNMRGLWGKWTTTNKRPAAAWYDPRQGKAKLPPIGE